MESQQNVAEKRLDLTKPWLPPIAFFLSLQLILLENVESQRSVAEKRLDSTTSKLRDTEKALENTKKEILNMQDMLEESQGQYIALEKKYYKAKKLIKEYQQRWVWEGEIGRFIDYYYYNGKKLKAILYKWNPDMLRIFKLCKDVYGF